MEECPRCKRYCEFRKPSTAKIVVRSGIGGLMNPKKMFALFAESMPEGYLHECTACNAVSAKCPQCGTLSLGTTFFTCRNCKLEFGATD